MSNDNDKAAFAVIVTYDKTSYRRLFFVSALSLQDAYQQVLNAPGEAFQHDLITFEGFVVNSEQLRAVVPDVKAIAKAYWMLAQENAGHVHRSNAADFEEMWRQATARLEAKEAPIKARTPRKPDRRTTKERRRDDKRKARLTGL